MTTKEKKKNIYCYFLFVSRRRRKKKKIYLMDDLLHEVFDFDVDTYATLIHLKVQIECAGQRNYSGRVYTVDPLTQRCEREKSFQF